MDICKFCGSKKIGLVFTSSNFYILRDKLTGRPIVMNEGDSICKACDELGFDYYRNLGTIEGYH